jgi:hypothetical protein
VPKTISYGFLGFDCVAIALELEKPQSFWLAMSSEFSDKGCFKGYSITERKKVSNNASILYAVKYNRKDGE